VPVPAVGPERTDGTRVLPLPTVLLAGGLLGGLLLSAVTARVAAVTARRARRSAQERLDAAVRTVAEEAVLAPVAAVLGEHERVRAALMPGGAPASSTSGRRGRAH
jgi:hypothetical protein